MMLPRFRRWFCRLGVFATALTTFIVLFNTTTLVRIPAGDENPTREVHCHSNYPNSTSERSVLQNSVKDNSTTLHAIYQQRAAVYQNFCRTMPQQKDLPFFSRDPFVYLPANLSVCFVPKVGSTIWKRVFFFLLNDTGTQSVVKSPLDIDRLYVHYGGQTKINKTLHMSDSRDRKLIFSTFRAMFVRDPWSRLWSGYVDKFVLPDSWLDHGKRILEMRVTMAANLSRAHVHVGRTFKSNDSRATLSRAQSSIVSVSTLQNCSDDVTFSEFFFYALYVNHDMHWRPIFQICNPCIYQPHVLGKLETFSQDSQYILNATGLTYVLPEKYYSSHVEDELFLLVDYHFRLWQSRTALHRCLDMVGLANRLWQAFQLNGYISMAENFPKQELQQKLRNATVLKARDIFTRLAIMTSDKDRLTNSERAALRHKIMTAAYRTVPRPMLDQMQKYFRLDFELFQYDPAPPDIFVREQTASE